VLAALFTPENIIALLTLAALEIVLGIDNLVFISILTGRLPEAQQRLARQIGLMAALGTRLLLLFSLNWIAKLTTPLFEVPFIPMLGEGGEWVPWEVTGRSLILAIGGLFLLYKAVTEIYHKVELHDEEVHARNARNAFGAVIFNIAIMDIIFSLDSVITAVGMAEELWVMVGGVILAMIVMLIFANSVANFINKYSSLKILALAFLMMIGTLLVAESLHFEIPKGFVYFAIFFSLAVDLIQIRYEANVQRKAAAALEEPSA